MLSRSTRETQLAIRVPKPPESHCRNIKWNRGFLAEDSMAEVDLRHIAQDTGPEPDSLEGLVVLADGDFVIGCT